MTSFTIPIGMTQEQVARLCGVSLRTVSHWVAGTRQPSARALAAMEVADSAAIEAAEPMILGERIATLRAIQQEQFRAICRLEDDLAQARRDMDETARRLNALYAERRRGSR